jgi:hypothetical protein
MKHFFYNNKIITPIGSLPQMYEGRFTALTDDQEAFYEENPTATVGEIRACALRTVTPPVASKLRERAYATRRVVSYRSELVTIDKANELVLCYLAEENTVMVAELQEKIKAAKAAIRAEFPDTE